MNNYFGRWESTSESDEIAAAMRAARTSSRRAFDTNMQYRMALSRGNPAEINAARAAYRQAWESDYRTKGGQFFGEVDKNWVGLPIIGVLALALLFIR